MISALTTAPMLLGAGGLDIDVTVAIHFVIFTISIFAMHFLIIKPYLQAREAREEGTQGSRQDADEMAFETAAELTKYEEGLSRAKREALELFEARRTKEEGVKGGKVDEVRREVAAKITQERAELRASVTRATEQVESRAQDLAAQMVQKVIPSA